MCIKAGLAFTKNLSFKFLFLRRPWRVLALCDLWNCFHYPWFNRQATATKRDLTRRCQRIFGTGWLTKFYQCISTLKSTNQGSPCMKHKHTCRHLCTKRSKDYNVHPCLLPNTTLFILCLASEKGNISLNGVCTVSLQISSWWLKALSGSTTTFLTIPITNLWIESNALGIKWRLQFAFLTNPAFQSRKSAANFCVLQFLSIQVFSSEINNHLLIHHKKLQESQTIQDMAKVTNEHETHKFDFEWSDYSSIIQRPLWFVTQFDWSSIMWRNWAQMHSNFTPDSRNICF